MKRGGLTAETVEAKLHKLRGNLAAVGRSFGVTRQAVWAFIQKRPSLLAAANDVREARKDNAESALDKAINRGEAWAVCFLLKTQARDRGYIERHEHTAADGKPLPVITLIEFAGPSAPNLNGHRNGDSLPSADRASS